MRIFLRNISQRKALINIGTLFSSSSIARVLSAITVFALARQLGVETYGVYVASISLAKLTSVIFSLGLDSWLLRYGSRDKARLSYAIGSSLLIKSGIGLLWFIGMFLLSHFLNSAIFPSTLIVLSALAIWMEDLNNTARSAFKATLQNRTTAWMMVGSQLLLLLITLFFIQLGITNPNNYMLGQVITYVIFGGISFFLAWKSFGIQCQLKSLPRVLQETLPFGISQGLAIIYGRADIIIIIYVLGEAAAGIYAPAVSLMTTLFLIPLAIYEVTLPIASAAHATDSTTLKKFAFRLFRTSSLLGIVLGLGLAIIAYPLVWLFYGAEFIASADILTVLSMVLVFKSISFGVAAFIIAVGWQSKRVIVQAITAVFNIIATYIAVQTYGLTGVAYVYVITEFVLTTGYLLLWLRWKPPTTKTPHPLTT